MSQNSCSGICLDYLLNSTKRSNSSKLILGFKNIVRESIRFFADMVTKDGNSWVYGNEICGVVRKNNEPFWLCYRLDVINSDPIDRFTFRSISCVENDIGNV